MSIMMKFNKLKTMMDLLPMNAVRKVAESFTHGVAKYARDDWRNGGEWSRVYGAMQRHFTDWLDGEDIIPDQGVLHLAAIAWGAIVLIFFQIVGVGKDDRFKSPHVDPLYQIKPGHKGQLLWQEACYKEIFTAVREAKENLEPISDPEYLNKLCRGVFEKMRPLKPADDDQEGEGSQETEKEHCDRLNISVVKEDNYKYESGENFAISVRYDADVKDYTSMDLTGQDFSGQDLRGYKFGGAILKNANFRDADLRGAYLNLADVEDADFIRADIRGAKTYGTDFTKAYIQGIVTDDDWVHDGVLFDEKESDVKVKTSLSFGGNEI